VPNLWTDTASQLARKNKIDMPVLLQCEAINSRWQCGDMLHTKEHRACHCSRQSVAGATHQLHQLEPHGPFAKITGELREVEV
jgi:hypothetical protein